MEGEWAETKRRGGKRKHGKGGEEGYTILSQLSVFWFGYLWCFVGGEGGGRPGEEHNVGNGSASHLVTLALSFKTTLSLVKAWVGRTGSSLKAGRKGGKEKVRGFPDVVVDCDT